MTLCSRWLHAHVPSESDEETGCVSCGCRWQDIADPFFAYCKQHADKHSSRLKRRNWLAVQSNMKNFENRLNDREKVLYTSCVCVCVCVCLCVCQIWPK